MKQVESFLWVLAYLSCVVRIVALDDIDDDINLDPTFPRGPQTGSRINPSEIDTTAEPLPSDINNVEPDCECVSFYLCKDNVLNTNGDGFLDVR